MRLFENRYQKIQINETIIEVIIIEGKSTWLALTFLKKISPEMTKEQEKLEQNFTLEKLILQEMKEQKML